MKIKVKKLLQCRVTIFVVLFWAVFSIVGYVKKDSVYKNYSVDAKEAPYFVLVLQGVRDGLYPWSSEPPDFWEEWEQLVEGVQEPGDFWVSSTNESGGSAGSNEVSAGTDAEENGNDGSLADIKKIQEESPQNASGDGDMQTQLQFVDVDETYFDDAVFIGDSRTVGLRDYSGLEKPVFYATVGMNIYDMWTEPFCEVDGENITLEEALRLKQFKKIYFQIGINEMGRGTLESFIMAYYQTVEKFKELQPNAVIYVQGIMRVAKEKSDTDAIFNNPGINLRNEHIAQLADNKKVFYIDVNEAVCDEEGHLRADLTFDNLHLLGSKYGIWVEFLKTKGLLLE